MFPPFWSPIFAKTDLILTGWELQRAKKSGKLSKETGPEGLLERLTDVFCLNFQMKTAGTSFLLQEAKPVTAKCRRFSLLWKNIFPPILRNDKEIFYLLHQILSKKYFFMHSASL